jgi:hypothetical protein
LSSAPSEIQRSVVCSGIEMPIVPLSWARAMLEAVMATALTARTLAKVLRSFIYQILVELRTLASTPADLPAGAVNLCSSQNESSSYYCRSSGLM